MGNDKIFSGTTGEILPVAWSYGHNHAAMTYQENGWGLVWLSLDVHQLVFLKTGTDPNVQVVGRPGSKPTPLLLETYADKLDPDETYGTLEQVLEKLGEWEPRFLLVGPAPALCDLGR